jgi:hypothetical protein
MVSIVLHVALSEASGVPIDYGKNLDALVDCLTHLDDPNARMSRVHLFPGQVALLVLDHADSKCAINRPRSERWWTPSLS